MIKRIRSVFVSSLVLAIAACTNTLSGNTNLSFQENFKDLDQEYSFKTQALTKPYLKRKLIKWLTEPVDGPKLVKEIAYAKNKNPGLFCEIGGEPYGPAGTMLDTIKSVPAVTDRETIDTPFSEFLNGCGYTPPIGPLSGEFQANTYNTGYQQGASTAMDSTGRFVVTWWSYGQDNNTSGIYAQLYDSTGSPTGSEFQVNTYIPGEQRNPAVAMDGNGDFVITWQSGYQPADGDGESYGIFARRYDNSGAALDTSEFQVNTYTTGNQDYPSVGMDSNGDFVIAWKSFGQERTGNNYGIYAQRYNSDGSKPLVNGDEFHVNTDSTGNQMYPSVGMDSAGDFVITWMSGYFSGTTQDGSGYGIYAQRYDSTGTPADTEFHVSTYTTGDQQYPSAAMDSAGDFVISWYSMYQDGNPYGEIYGQRYNSDGSKPLVNGDEFHVNTFTTGRQQDPSVAMDSSGNFLITWMGAGPGGESDNNDIYARRYDNGGESFNTAEFPVNTFTTGSQLYPAVTGDSNGDFVVIWTGAIQDGDFYGIYGKRYDSNGNTIN
jgi:hypothetical protein